MAALYKTQCPHCAAQFRVSDQHLQQAKGAVRCGSCMLVFQANEHLIELPHEAVKPPLRPQQPEAPKDWQNMDLLPEKPAPASTVPEKPKLELSDSFLALTSNDYGNALHQEDFTDMRGAAKPQSSANNDDAWAEALLRELEDDNEVDSDLPSSSLPTNGIDKTPAQDSFSEEPADKELDEWLNEGLFDELLLPEPAKELIPPANIFSRPSINWGQQIKWTLLSLLLLVFLAAQFIYFNFDRLSRNTEFRPVMSELCNLIGCQLPSMTNLNKIRSQHLVVRTHPEFENALQVDALLYNLAEHPQPYPDLALTFSNHKGDVVASRLFTPAEYLPGNLKDSITMPSSIPVRISLTLINPSSEALSHRLTFHSPNQPSTP